MPKPGTQVFSNIPAFTVKPMSPKAFGLAIALTAIAFILRLAAGYIDPMIPPFAGFFAAILVATILAGVMAGAFAATLGFALAFAAFSALMPNAFSSTSIFLYVLTALAIIWVSEQYRTLLRRLGQEKDASDRQMALIAAENDILGHIAADKPLSETLEQLTRSAERYSQGKMLASVLLMDRDGRHLRHGAAPSLPDEYNRVIDGVEIGAAVGSCGTAAFRKQPVYVSDIERDPLWADYKDLASSHGLKACWSHPILSNTGEVLGTFALYHREQRAPEAKEVGIVDLLMRIAMIAIEHERNRQQRQLLIDELNHRVKNILSVVLSIASTTLRTHTDSASYRAFEERIIAMSKTHNLLTDSHWSNVDLRALISEIAVFPFSSDRQRFYLSGPTSRIPSQLTVSFALLLHELCTNAAKYGALSREEGQVQMDWRHSDDHQRFIFRWSENGGPPVRVPSQQGFGSRLIKHAFNGVTGSNVTIDYLPEGLVCKLVLPADQILVSG